MLTRIDNLVKALKAHTSSGQNTDELVFQSLIESAGDPTADKPPTPPPGVHPNQQERPTFSKMMAALVDQVKKHVDDTNPGNRLEGYIAEIGEHEAKVLDLQQQLLKRLAELEKLEKAKITSESIHEGFNTSHVSKATGPIVSASTSASLTSASGPELLNPARPALAHVNSNDSGAEADIEDAVPSTPSSPHRATSLGIAFSKIPPTDYRASLQYISQNPAVLAERETDGLLLEAFDAELASNPSRGRACVHQGLLLQYCRSLGRDGVALFFKRITTPQHNARKLFYDDVNSTYARLRDRAREMAANGEAFADEGEGEGSGGVEQIQLHAVDPSQSINIRVPSAESEPEAWKLFEAFPPGLRRALESKSLDAVNKVLGKMSVSEAEEVVAQLSEGNMLNVEEGIIDATTEEGQEVVKGIERERKMPDFDEEGDAEEEVRSGEPGLVDRLSVDEVD